MKVRAVSAVLLEPSVFLLKFLRAMNVARIHTAELSPSGVQGGVQNPNLATEVFGLFALFESAQNSDDLFVSKSFLHVHSWLDLGDYNAEYPKLGTI